MANSGILQRIFEAKLTALRVTVIYILLGGLWVLFSDRFLSLLTNSPAIRVRLEPLTDCIYILITAGLLYKLIQQGLAAINFQKTLLECLSEASPDGILVVSSQRHWLYWNQRFIDLWQSPLNLLQTTSNKAIFHWISKQVIDPETFLTKTAYLYDNQNESSQEEIQHQDGRILDCYSTPIKNKEGTHYGRVWFYRDITKNRQNEKTLHETTQKLRSLIQASPLAIYVLDLERMVTLWNPASEHMFGWSESEALGCHAPMVTPENLVEFRTMREHVLAGEPLNGVEVRRHKKDGSPIDLSLSTAVLTDAKGDVTGVMSIAADVTARKQAEEKLLYQANLLQNVSNAIIATDLNFKITSWNRAAELLYGWSALEVIGQPVSQFLQTKFADDQTELVRQHFLEYGIWQGEAIHKHRNGANITVMASVSLIKDSVGKPVGVVTVNRDITSRKQAEIALRQSEERFAKAFRANPAAIMITNLSDGKIIDVNESYQRLLGYNRTELIGRTEPELNIFTNPIERDRITQQLYYQKLAHNYETTVWTKSGATRHVLFSIETIELEGKTCLLSLLYDITDRKQAEAALQQSEERLHNLREIDKAILLAHSPQEIATAALTRLRRLIPCQRTSVILFDLEMNEMLILAAEIDGITTLNAGVRRPVETEWLAELKRGETILVENILALTEPGPVRQALKAEGIRSYINIPLFIRAKLIGSLNLASNQPDTFRPDHVAIAQEVADQLAIALHNTQLFEQVHQGHEQLRKLADYLQAVREEERARIARDLHDEFGQALTALKMDVTWLAKHLPKYATPLHQKTGMMVSLIDTTIQLIRRVSAELRPGVLDDLGLVAAIEWQGQEFTARTGIQCQLRLCEHDIILGRDLATAIFRIFQEILTNVARHAQASRVEVELNDKPDELELTVHDDGQGITVEQLNNPKSLGLLGMRERATSWGGTITFYGVAGQGTTVTLRIPRVKAAEEDQND